MAKGKQRPPQYNRQSKGYQQNIYKQQMKEKNVEMPKQIDMDKFTKINRVLMIVWVIVTVALAFLVGWKASVVSLVIGALYMGGFVYYINNYLKKYITAYKKMGIPKELYVQQLKRGGTDQKQIDRMIKIWDKAPSE